MAPSLSPGLPGSSSYTLFPWVIAHEAWLQATALAFESSLGLGLGSVKKRERKREEEGRGD